MKRRIVFEWVLIICILFSCKENYEPPVVQMNLNYLVVDGTIINGNDSTVIRLSRTQLLDQNPATLGERNAQVSLEDTEGNTVYNFVQLNDKGDYTVPAMNLDISKKYRLRINTANGSQYVSDDLNVKETPAIDSISWTQNNDGVTIYANTHDPQNNTKYYQWQYIETWDYNANFYSFIKYNPAGQSIDEIFPIRGIGELIYHCWTTTKSNQILLGSSVKLAADVISLSPLRYIPRNSVEINSLYSILVKQFAITKEAFAYFDNLKRISEQTGSLFDAQPSQLTGNIHSVNKPDEPVIGFLNVSTLQQQRIFIDNDQVKPWRFILYCEPEKKVPLDLDSFRYYFGGPSPQLIPTAEIFTPLLSAIGGATPRCTDCTARGGTTIKPDFWP